MHAPEMLRNICRELCAERDVERFHELLTLLHVFTHDDKEDANLLTRDLRNRFSFLKEELTQ
jgi:hypothetical protein